MTAAEFAKVTARVHHSERKFAAEDDPHHDKYGCDVSKSSHDDMFDARHTEDVFPY